MITFVGCGGCCGGPPGTSTRSGHLDHGVGVGRSGIQGRRGGPDRGSVRSGHLHGVLPIGPRTVHQLRVADDAHHGAGAVPGAAGRASVAVHGQRSFPTAQPAVQDLIWGRALELPFIIVVKPNVLPLPLERTVITLPLLSQLKLPLQVVETRCGEVIATTTDQVLAPLTVTEVLYRSPQTVPGVIDAVQLPPGGGVVGGGSWAAWWSAAWWWGWERRCSARRVPRRTPLSCHHCC